jgi:transposase
MLQLSCNTKYYLYSETVDMRKGVYSLCGVVQNNMKLNVLDKDVFVFLNRKHTTIKLLQWEGDGFALYEKRLAQGTFDKYRCQNKTEILSQYQLQLLLQGVILKSVKMKTRYISQ